jgi:hypothetical protein
MIRVLVALALVMPVAFSACKKADEGTGTAAKEEYARMVSVSDAEADWVFDDLFNNVLGVNAEVGLGGLGIFGRVNMSEAQPAYAEASVGEGNRVVGVDSAACFLVNIVQLNLSTRFPLQITVDFGLGCPGKDGRIRKGKIKIVYTGNISNAGNSATTTFDSYFVDNIKVEGTLKIANNSTLTKKIYTSLVTNARLTKGNGNFIQWNSEKTISQVEGMLTPLINLDDVFNLSGQSNGSAQLNGRFFQWSTAITAPLVKKFTCPWIVKGSISLKKGTSEVAVLDYGAGNCDNKASFTLNGAAHEITLH